MSNTQTPEQLMEQLAASGAFESEELGFALELALAFGFETDDDLTTVTARNEQLYALMKHVGYAHKRLGTPHNPVSITPDSFAEVFGTHTSMLSVVNTTHDETVFHIIEPDLPEHEPIHCDVCGKHVTDYEGDLFHHTGMLNGALNPHVHVCAQCHRKANPLIVDFDVLREAHDLGLDCDGAQYE